ncbi:MAG: hypothetical protein V4726_21790 [Verrucomicrobiota bacterium]
MKLPSLIIAAVVSLAALAPVTASAGGPCRPGSSRVSYDHCGRRVVSIYTFVGRDYHGCPIFRWIAQPCYERPVYRGGGGRGHRDGGRGDYDRRGGGGRGDYHRGHSERGRGGFSIRISR